MANTSIAYDLLMNGSIVQAGIKAYEPSLGIWLWPLFFIFTLVIVHIKTENPSYLFVYAVLGNVLLANFLTTITSKIFYITLVISLALVLWKVYGSKKTE